MSKHTPGPWLRVHNHPSDESRESIAYITTPDRASWDEIATVFSCDRDETQAANADLIAAAPTLLDALIEIEKAEGEFDRDPLQHAGNCIDSMRAIARAAIAKATGAV